MKTSYTIQSVTAEYITYLLWIWTILCWSNKKLYSLLWCHFHPHQQMKGQDWKTSCWLGISIFPYSKYLFWYLRFSTGVQKFTRLFNQGGFVFWKQAEADLTFTPFQITSQCALPFSEKLGFSTISIIIFTKLQKYFFTLCDVLLTYKPIYSTSAIYQNRQKTLIW